MSASAPQKHVFSLSEKRLSGTWIFYGVLRLGLVYLLHIPDTKSLLIRAQFLFAIFLRIQTAYAGNVTTLDDITYWIGEGDNRAGLVIDWDGASSEDESLVWGYRFDDTVTGEDMLRAIVWADARLFTKMSAGGGIGAALYGIGYDLNDDGLFAISDGTDFNSHGIAISGPPDDASPAAIALDPNDHYAEGWFTGFWNYGISDSGNPFTSGSWKHSSGGFSSRFLIDGDWDSWAFTSTFDFNAFANNPHAAVPPFQFASDFELDGDVDGADLLIWHTRFGIPFGAMRQDGDADLNGSVDGSDFLIWQREFGSMIGSGSSSDPTIQVTVPEPAARLLVGVMLLMYVFPRRTGCPGLV